MLDSLAMRSLARNFLDLSGTAAKLGLLGLLLRR